MTNKKDLIGGETVKIELKNGSVIEAHESATVTRGKNSKYIFLVKNEENKESNNCK